MIPRSGPGSRRQAGFALADVLTGLTLLSFVTLTLLNIYLSGITHARTAGVDAEAAMWVQAETDYLRWVGYPSVCLAAGTRTITPSSTPCTSVEPALPAEFAQATIQVEDSALGRPGLKRMTFQVYRVPGAVLYEAATYVTRLQ